MEARFLPPITCPVVIGRVQELALLCQLVERVHSGETQVVLVCGEAGVGKSRLVAEALASAVAYGFLLLEGQCFLFSRHLFSRMLLSRSIRTLINWLCR